MHKLSAIQSAVFLLFVILFQVFPDDLPAAERKIPASPSTTRVRIHPGMIITGSDSIYVNAGILSRDREYTIDYLNGIVYFNTDFSDNDTLTIIYTPLPSWLKKRYGLDPDISRETPYEIPLSGIEKEIPPRYPSASTMTIQGAKKFSLLSRTGETSQFNQSLELSLQGEISPGLEISGAVSDQGYDPAYGFLNSRISELDKLNLEIKSRAFQAGIGDLEMTETTDRGYPVMKRFSGMRAALQVNKFSVMSAFGRPQGRFTTSKFTGLNNIQGPYRLTAENIVAPVVPGSEIVWLNGRRLDRGADKDYIMDYSSATITFTSRVPVDSRTRIEVDFEPLTSDYQKEMYRFSTAFADHDSTLFLGFDLIDEGDNKNRLKSGDLSQSDIARLEAIGDSVSRNFKPGEIEDTLGDYILATDSLGDQYFQYVGDSLGDYRVSFTAVPSGTGDYIYEGADRFRYVGKNRGDYLPQIRIPVPANERFYQTQVRFKPGKIANVGMTVRQTDYDRNLFSSLDDNNNIGRQYHLLAETGHIPEKSIGRSGARLSVKITDEHFVPRVRSDQPDLARKFYFPENFSSDKGQEEFDFAGALGLPGPYNLHLSTGLLDYDDRFNSYFGIITIVPSTNFRFLPKLFYHRLKAELDSTGRQRPGNYEGFGGALTHALYDRLNLDLQFHWRRGWNHYQLELKGTTETDLSAAIRYRSFAFEVQHYLEDTLDVDWRTQFKSSRAVISFVDQESPLKKSVYIVGRKTGLEDAEEYRLMGRFDIAYNSIPKNLAVESSYSLSDESRFERGLRYLEVEPGQGKFILDNDQYIPDPQGNYIEIEELHSRRTAVKKDAKSFMITCTPDDFYLRLLSNSTEELLPEGRRSLFWLIPFISYDNQPCLFRKLLYTGEVKLIRTADYFIVNLSASHNLESRRLGESLYERYDNVLKAKFHQPYRNWLFFQDGTVFKSLRDGYFSSPGNIRGYQLAAGVARILKVTQINGSFAFRHAVDDKQSKSDLFIVVLDQKIRSFRTGQTQIEIEGYLQSLSSRGPVSYRLTDNHDGRKGLNWSLRFDNEIKKDLKIMISFRARHAEGRTPEFFGKGEVIASF